MRLQQSEHRARRKAAPSNCPSKLVLPFIVVSFTAPFHTSNIAESASASPLSSNAWDGDRLREAAIDTSLSAGSNLVSAIN